MCYQVIENVWISNSSLNTVTADNYAGEASVDIWKHLVFVANRADNSNHNRCYHRRN